MVPLGRSRGQFWRPEAQDGAQEAKMIDFVPKREPQGLKNSTKIVQKHDQRCVWFLVSFLDALLLQNEAKKLAKSCHECNQNVP